MVNEPRIIVKNDFFTESLQLMYDDMVERVRNHQYTLYLACCKAVSALQYILYGKYSRKIIIDARVTGYHDSGIPEIEIQTIEGFRMQRLKHKDCGHTHALMFEWFIPYQKYSIRYVLLHLQRYFGMKGSIESYCLDNDIPITTFRKWMQWFKENMPLLTEMGIVRDREENSKKLKEWLSGIIKDTEGWLLKSLSGLNRVLFQRHDMPANYVNYGIEKLRSP